MANIQDFSVIRYVRDWISPLLRQPKFTAFLQALVAPLQSRQDNLKSVVYPDVERRARYNAQVAKFERILNETFGYSGTTIYIDEAGNASGIFTYNSFELQPLYVYNVAENHTPGTYTYNPLEYIPTFDFTVHIPSALYTAQLARVKSLVTKYSLAGVTFNIVPF